MIPFNYVLVFSAALYIIGVYCLAAKRNMMRIVLGIEILVNAANINFIALSVDWSTGFVDPLAHSMVIVSITLAGCVSSAALALVILAHHHFNTINVREIRRLKG
jgi:NADH-quinone oxidoreductase subunit K